MLKKDYITKKIGILDYGIGNIQSIKNAFGKISIECSLITLDNISCLKNYDGIVLPGVGSYNKVMTLLENKNAVAYINDYANSGGFLLGICLGMQILGKFGDEGGLRSGLGILDFTVSKLEYKNMRVPHVGWCNLLIKKENNLLLNINENDDFYFTHSYFASYNEKIIVATSNEVNPIPAIIQSKNIIGVQFHPEKSQSKGLIFLNNFISLCGENAT